ncbi:MAG: hypothetical protein A2503_14435 [Burkholderiales bacterium RIFOXYD12_FULL_59_19]|nr:MAG: hypothetical protein A2503_14435 [Burkholderiales bacterium RIFOXYD12_FULL_59_19]
MTRDGNQLVQCFNAISAFGKEIDSLCSSLNELLTKEIGKAVLSCKVAGEFSEDSRQDEACWLYTDVASSLPLMGKTLRKNRPEMYIGYQISMIGDGMSFCGNEDPLLHVYLWRDENCFDDECYMRYPLAQDPPYQLISNRLIVWGDLKDGWKEYEWTFSIRLLSLDSSKALLDRVIKPAIALLAGTAVTSALPDNLPGLVIYSDESVLNPTVRESINVN